MRTLLATFIDRLQMSLEELSEYIKLLHNIFTTLRESGAKF